MERIEPLLWLALTLLLMFGGVVAIVILFMRRQGGSLVGGLFRSMDFVCYLIILLQTTLYIANGTVKNTMDVVLNEFAEEQHGFIKSFFEVSLHSMCVCARVCVCVCVCVAQVEI